VSGLNCIIPSLSDSSVSFHKTGQPAAEPKFCRNPPPEQEERHVFLSIGTITPDERSIYCSRKIPLPQGADFEGIILALG
jgi:hypothetical protein